MNEKTVDDSLNQTEENKTEVHITVNKVEEGAQEESVSQDGGVKCEQSESGVNEDKEVMQKLQEEIVLLQQNNAELQQKTTLVMQQRDKFEGEIKILNKRLDNSKDATTISVVTEFLDVMDALKYAIAASEKAQNSTQSGDDMESLKKQVEILGDGFKAIQNSLHTVFNRLQVQTIVAKVGDLCDSKFHEPLTMIRDANQPDNVIVLVQSEGYQLKNKVIRASKVIVNSNSLEN